MYVTRIAPSPTGDFHLGTARTAYFNYLTARASGGKFILRVDDTDLARSNDNYIKVILEAMAWLGLEHDQLEYQSKRKNCYMELAESMIDDGLAFEHEGCIKLTKEYDNHNFVLIKSDGMPTYHFATCVDDFDMKVNHIIRGTDHQPNLPKHELIWNSFAGGYKFPQVTHLGLIFQNKKKLSKRDGAASLLWYREQGYSPDALLNFMLRLGWAESDGKVIPKITKEMACEIFLTKGKMRPQPSNLDLNLLNAIQRRYK